MTKVYTLYGVTHYAVKVASCDGKTVTIYDTMYKK
jgi:hypothetical protein|nr:MAG TPA: hypothetical protein [Caudoviricetes sp.]